MVIYVLEPHSRLVTIGFAAAGSHGSPYSIEPHFLH